MATSIYSSGIAPPESSSSSSASSSRRSAAQSHHRPCALDLPGTGGASAVSSSKLLDELATVACSPESPLMKAVQAVWPDFNLSPLDHKVSSASTRRTVGSNTVISSRVRGTSSSPLKPPSTTQVKSLSSASKVAKGSSTSSTSSSRRHSSNNRHRNGMASNENGSYIANGSSLPAVARTESVEDAIERFADIPPAALRCFQTGTTLLAMFTAEHGSEQWISTETLRQEYPQDAGTSAASKDLAEMTRLRVVDCHAIGRKPGEPQDRVKLTFLVMPTVHQIVASCFVSHPFLVEKKGWTSLDPNTTLVQEGLSCQQLSLGDLCVPPVAMEENGIGREEIMAAGNCSESSSGEYSDEEDDENSEESKAARLLSQLATGQLVYSSLDEVHVPEEEEDDDDEEEEESPKPTKRRSKKKQHQDYYDADDFEVAESEGSDDYDYATETKVKPSKKKAAISKRPKLPKKKQKKQKHGDGDGETPSKMEPGSKRPMNAFMLFAQKYRQDVTKQHPGKDNRAISTLLGTYWKELDNQARVAYVVEARALAQQHQKLYPNCWKRKRTNAAAAAAAAAAKN
ncbi:HMG box-containing protein 1-like [Sycon ciliatum]|uniref:HMG box-containing protein 1-like n=1 Tax=Sycon ciliatum TaxID=27933 RepID=UPI0031F661CD